MTDRPVGPSLGSARPHCAGTSAIVLQRQHVLHQGVVDPTQVAHRGVLQAGRRQPIDLTQRAARSLMEHREPVGGEGVPVSAGLLQPILDVLRGVLGQRRTQRQTVGEP
jgi:hypothetical protein